jgi:alkylation response protein AidB-like acyl-CoA dehydrogenase
MSETLQEQIVAVVREFVERKVLTVAGELEHDDEYPVELVAEMKEMGLFGAIIPEQYGGLGLDCTTYARIIEELSRGWMSLTGIINSHLIMAYDVWQHGTEEQKWSYLPAMCLGEKRGGVCISESHAGSDVQAIRTTATRHGDEYIINGSKMWVTNGSYGNTFALLAKTDKNADPPHRGMSLFIIEKGGRGFTVSRRIEKLGYKGVDTVELAFDDFRVPAGNLIGGEEGRGFAQIMSGLELGRINVAARGVGLARAAFEEAIRYAQQRETFGKPICQHQAIQLKLADMATKIEAAKLLTYSAAARKDRGERCDLEAGMAKLFATEACQEVTLEAMRIHGGYGYAKDFKVERFYRDAPLLLIGEGTNEIQRIVIARNLLKRFQI